MDQLLGPSKRNDKSLNQVNDLNKNCTLKRHSDVNNSATNSHIELDNNSQAHPKTPTDLPNRFSSGAHVQPNLGIPVTRGFKIASINLASLYKNIDQLRIYMLSKTVDILAINETRLDSSIQDGEVSIPGYTLERKDRNRNGGGVALYITDSINYKRLIDLPDDNIELISIQVSKPKAKPFIVCTWYRPPGSTTELTNRFEDVLQKLDSYHMEVDIIGDLNCNVGATSPDCSTQKLLDICDTYQYRQLIDQPTRITQLTSSIIDLFLTNHPWNFSDSGVTDIGISDHCLVYAIRKICIPKSNPKTVTSRCFKNFIPDSFRTDLSMVPWHLIEQEHNPDIA